MSNHGHAEGNTSGGAAEHERLSHAQMVAAAEKARLDVSPLAPWPGQLVGGERNRHVDDLLAILRLHTPGDLGCWYCRTTTYPCRTVQIVADRLRGWGVL